MPLSRLRLRLRAQTQGRHLIPNGLRLLSKPAGCHTPAGLFASGDCRGAPAENCAREIARGGVLPASMFRPAPSGALPLPLRQPASRRGLRGVFAGVAIAMAVAGCVSASREERAAVDRVRETGDRLHPGGRRPALPELTAGSPEADYVRFALLNHPRVEAAFQDWRAAVLAIAPARALPDPKLTFQADIAGTLTSLMPGLMVDVMSTGRREAMAGEATAASEVAYRRYVGAVLGVAADVKKAWADLGGAEETLALKRRMLDLKAEAVQIAHASHVTTHVMGSLDDMVRLMNEEGRLRVDVANLEDEDAALRVQFKTALGIPRDAPDPVFPARFALPPPAPFDEESVWRSALAANPRLGEMRAMVAMAVAETAVEEKARTPDFAAGLMADLKMKPVLWRPLGEVTLPVWREKIAAAIAAGRAREDAAGARLRNEELMTAADLARMIYMVREADRMIAYLDGVAIPNLNRNADTIAAAYGTGMTGFAMVPEAQEMVLAMQVERVAALRDREKTLADLSLLVAGQAPEGAPLPEAPAGTRKS